MLMVNNIPLYGELQDVLKEPPLVVIEVYDDDALVRVSRHMRFRELNLCSEGCRFQSEGSTGHG